MVAAVNTSFRTSEVPWDNVWTPLRKVATAEEALQAAGLDWNVTALKVFVDAGNGLVEFPDRRAIVRDKITRETEPDRFFSVRSDHYQILQNREAFTFFDNVVKSGEAMYHAAGSFNGGRLVYILAKLPDDIVVADQELIEQFILLTNTHDGTRQVRMGYLPVSKVRGSMLFSGQASKYNVGIRHIGTNFDGRVAEARRTLGIIKTWSKTADRFYHHMTTRKVTDAEVEAYLKQVFVDEEKDDEKEAHLERMVVQNLVADASTTALQDTLWAVYNASIKHIDQGNCNTNFNARARLNQIWFGNRARLKDRANEAARKLLRLPAAE